MGAYYGFKYARSADGSTPQSVRILPVADTAGGLTVGDPVAVASGVVVGFTSGLSGGVYGVVVALGRTAASVAQSVSVGGYLTNFADPSNGSTAFSATDDGWAAVVVADNAVFKTVYQGAPSGTAPTYAALIGTQLDLSNNSTGTTIVDYAAVNTNHLDGNRSKLGAATFSSLSNDITVLGLASRGAITEKGVPITYYPSSGSLTNGDEIYVTFNTVQYNPA
jgi:hypothetical protein